MRIKRITVTNWLSFRGVNVLDLDAGVHAVVARRATDAASSNWAGKTAMLEAVPFALFGAHRFRTEDEWISTGETQGGVMLELDDGTTVQRTRARGRSTQLVVDNASGAAAQDEIVRRIGLNEADFMATCFFAQKQMSKLVTARPAERMEIIGGWLGLERIQACEERAREKLAAITSRVAEGERRIAGKQQVIDEAFTLHGVKTVGELAQYAAEQRKHAEEEAAAFDVLTENVKLADQAAEYTRVVEQGKALRDEAKALPTPDEATTMLAESMATVTKAADEHRRLKVLATGNFDGACPVSVGLVCPATEKINGARVKHRKELDKATKHLALHHTTHDGFKQTASQSVDVNRRLDALRAKARDLKPAHDATDGATYDADEVRARHVAVNALLNEARGIEAAVEQVTRWTGEVAALATTNAVDVLAATPMREAVAVFGRNGAQRRIAETALAEIEKGANTLLGNAGIALTVAVKWSREGQGLAAVCDQCGAPHASSQRVKVCERCGAVRGPKLVERLDVDLSDRSGAAEDIAGIALQLSAAAWLRAERSAAWSVCCIDEPLAACDAPNRRALAKVLATMLGSSYGFEQSFIVSHSSDTVDMMPNRVEIIASNGGSTFA